MKPTKLLITGEGGQGIQTIAKILAATASSEKMHVSYIPSFGVEQRGTPSVAFITLSKAPISYPMFQTADTAVILQKRSVEMVADYITPHTKILFDSSTVAKSDMPKSALSLMGLPATRYAAEHFSNKSFNMIVLGKLTKILNLDEKRVWDNVLQILGKKFKTKSIEDTNKNAFNFGLDAVFEFEHFSDPTYTPASGDIRVKGFGKKGIIVPSRCKGCGVCIEKCPVKALAFGETLGVFATPVPNVDLEKCIACGNCSRFCPDAAILIEKN